MTAPDSRPAAPRTMSAEETAALRRVQRRILAIVFLAVALHGVFGLIGVAHVLEGQDRHGDATALVVMSGIVAIIVCVATRVILAARPWSLPWLLLSLTPTVAAFIWVV